jgi:hypothetical protein
MLQGSQTAPKEILPKAISSGPQEHFDERDEKGWLGYFVESSKAGCHRIAIRSWQILSVWFDSWFMVVLTGCVIGVVIGLVYRWSLLPN